MPKSLLTTVALGPFDGIVDTKGASIPAPNKLRNAKNLVFSGEVKLSVRSGSVLALTLQDDAGTPADVTSVLAVETFMDGAVAVAHSTVTSKVYLYRLPATMDGWYDDTGALQTTLFPEPVGVLWSAIPTPPDVSLAEGLGMLYAANSAAIDENGVYYRTRTVVFDAAGVPTVADMAASGTGGSAGSDFAYFTAVASFHQHLWGIGYGIGNTGGYSSFRPELARFTPPSFGELQTADSIVIGDRVRSLRERGVILRVAGNALFLGASKALFRITGYGRDSWTIETLDEKYGVVGPKAGVAVGGKFYYWSGRGLMRCGDSGAPQPLWDAIVGAVATVANEATIVLGFDAASDQVLVTYDTGSGVRTLCAFDTRRDDFVSVDGDIGLVIACAGIVEPIYKSTAIPPSAPTAPTISSTANITDTTGQPVFIIADAMAQHEVSYRVQGNPSYTVAPLADPAVGSVTLSSLTAGTAYEWRVRATRFGGFSAYVGPVTASRFTTTGTPPGPGAAAPTALSVAQTHLTTVLLTWANADPTLPTQILRSTDGSYFAQVGTAVAGAVSKTNDAGAFGTVYYAVRHVAADGTLGTLSAVFTIDIA